MGVQVRATLAALPVAINWGNVSAGILLAWLVGSPWAWLVLVPLFAAEAFRLWMGVAVARVVAEQQEAKKEAFEAQLAAMVAEKGEE